MLRFNHRTKKYAEWTILIFSILIVGFFLFPYIPIENNYSLKTVLSGSMEPAIKTGAVVLVKPTDTYREGDIIGYMRPQDEKPTSHRIYEKKIENGEIIFITKGDANENIDTAPVKKDWVIGKIYFSIPYLGYLAKYSQTRQGFFILILIPAGIIIFDQLKNIAKEIKKIKKKKSELDI
jgi:signal peptidase I